MARANELSDNISSFKEDSSEQRKVIVDRLNESQGYFNYTRATLNFLQTDRGEAMKFASDDLSTSEYNNTNQIRYGGKFEAVKPTIILSQRKK